MGRSIGYARVSRDEQTTALQLDALARAGVAQTFEDAASGASRSRRPGLVSALAALGAGDVLVVWRLDRLARSVSDLLALVSEVEGKGASLRSLTEAIDTGSAVGRLVLNVLASIGQFERELTLERVHAGLDAARARGVVGGRRRVLPAEGEKVRALRGLIEQGESITSAARLLGVSRASAYRAMRAEIEPA